MQDSRLHKSCGPQEQGQQILGFPRKNFLLIPLSWSNCRAGWKKKGRCYKPTYRQVNSTWQKLKETRRSHLSFSQKTGSSQLPRESQLLDSWLPVSLQGGNVMSYVIKLGPSLRQEWWKFAGLTRSEYFRSIQPWFQIMYLRSEYSAAGWPGACFARAAGTPAISLWKESFKRENPVNLWVFQLV